VHQHEIVNGIEGIGPLALGTKNLFYKPQVLDRQAKLMSAGGQKLDLIGRVGEAMTAAQNKNADG